MQYSYRQELLKTQLETQEQTFHQISEELHDNIAQLLSSTRMLLGITERTMNQVPDSLRTADETLSKAIQDLRMLSKSLNKEWLRQFNFIENLKTEIERINAARTTHLELSTQVSTLPLQPESQVMLFRVVQEALQNCIKHSQATKVMIRIEQGEDIRVLIQDNGKGIQTDANRPAGVGMLNMNHRTKLLGGAISWSPAVTGGTLVTISVPVQSAQAPETGPSNTN